MKLICWFEIPVKDMQRAKTFYENVFDVAFDMQIFGGIQHAVFVNKRGGTFDITGALRDVSDTDEKIFGSVIFFDVNSLGIDNVLKNVEKFGGKILMPKTLLKNKLPDGKITIAKTYIDQQSGYVAYILDTEGNKLGLYSHG
ncbi:MAG TPA: VOC family protein [Bacteroidia bacterium]|jgi:predicted enzyme related to lactoylglutathione lyase|nr:VOC family protein [Bacteroidia bacterium]